MVYQNIKIDHIIKKNGAMAKKYLMKGKPKINKHSRGDMKLVTSVDPAPNEIIEKNLQELEETEELDKPSFNTRSIKKKAPPPPPKRTPSQEKELLKKKDAPKRKKKQSSWLMLNT